MAIIICCIIQWYLEYLLSSQSSASKPPINQSSLMPSPMPSPPLSMPSPPSMVIRSSILCTTTDYGRNPPTTTYNGNFFENGTSLTDDPYYLNKFRTLSHLSSLYQDGRHWKPVEANNEWRFIGTPKMSRQHFNCISGYDLPDNSWTQPVYLYDASGGFGFYVDILFHFSAIYDIAEDSEPYIVMNPAYEWPMTNYRIADIYPSSSVNIDPHIVNIINDYRFDWDDVWNFTPQIDVKIEFDSYYHRQRVITRRITRFHDTYSFLRYGNDIEIDLLNSELLGHRARIYIKWEGFYSQQRYY